MDDGSDWERNVIDKKKAIAAKDKDKNGGFKKG